MTKNDAMDALVHDVEQLLRHVGEQEILTRFNQLQRHEIQTKDRPGDVVTTADLEAENRLREGLGKLLPDSFVLGEEDCYRNPDIIHRLTGDQPVWVVDPLDGTNNFAKGKPCFAMICALIEGGQTQMGWIYDPVAGVCATARRGEGVYLAGQHISIESPNTIEDMTGSLGDGIRKRIKERKAKGEQGLPQHLVRYHCCGREYLDLLLGKIHFALYGGRLMPWDHAAGTLMIEEACGFARMGEGKGAYNPARISNGKHLLMTPNERTFDALHQVLFKDQDIS
ncbi:inositol monophosphatase family protein [Magnetovibrio sp.]|uniref:inositol monophosphatase family protein n=1 Tax=Magnetovibrio sp. TaxID=2024836 RepID=UPI002F94862B